MARHDNGFVSRGGRVTNSVCEWNTNYWAADVDLTCCAVWNSQFGNWRPCTLISPKHVISAHHFPPLPGNRAACHERLEAAVAAAYGWPSGLSDEEVLELLHALNEAIVDAMG